MNTHHRAFIVVAGAVACFIIVFLMSFSSYSYINRTTSQRNTIQQIAREWFKLKRYTIDFSRSPDNLEIIRRWRSSRGRFGSLIRKIDIRSQYLQPDGEEGREDKINRLMKRWEAISLSLEELERLSENETDDNSRGSAGGNGTPIDPDKQIRYLMAEFYMDSEVFEDWIDEALGWFDTDMINQLRVVEYLFVGFLVIVTAVLLLVLNTTRVFTMRLDRLTWALDSLREGCLITDASSRVLLMNRSARNLLGVEDEESAGGLHLRQLINPLSAGDTATSFMIGQPTDGIGETGSPDTFITIKDGRTLYTSVIRSDMDSDRKSAVLYSFADISRIVRLQDELARRKSLENYGTSVSSIAHALNNSFMGILGNLELAILSNESTSREAGFLKESKLAVLKSRDLVARLMNLTGRDCDTKKMVSLSSVLEQVISSFESGSRTRFRIRENGKNDTYVIINERKVHDALSLLLKTASENMEQEKGIDIAFSKESPGTAGKEYCCITVSYHGYTFTGGSPYSLFESLPGKDRSDSGMNLAVAATIIESQNGMLQAQTERLRGTKITVMLPAAEINDPVPKKGLIPQDTRYKLLLLEDEKIVRDIGEKMLSELGHSVTSVQSGEEAIIAFRKAILEYKPFDAVILDLSSPEGMDGTETFIELRKLDPNVQAFITSGYTEDPVLSRFEDFGFSGALPKPYDMAVLSEMLSRMKPPAGSPENQPGRKNTETV